MDQERQSRILPFQPGSPGLPAWGTPCSGAPDLVVGAPFCQRTTELEGRGLRASGGYVNPVEKPRAGELSKKDTKLDPFSGKKKQERIPFQPLCEEGAGFTCVRAQRFGGFKFSPKM